MAPKYRFDRFELDPDDLALREDGAVVPLQDLPLRLLIALVEKAPATVSREALRESLWPPGTFLDADASLNTAVARVRDALGDDASSPRFVATVPRRGYRFIPAVEAAAEAPARSPRQWTTVASLGLVLAVASGWFAVRSFRSESSIFEPGGASTPDGSSSVSDSQAREHLIVARHQAERRSRDGLEKAIAAFQTAAAVAPESVEAYSGLASAYALLGIYDFWRPREAFGPAETMAKRALDLDPNAAEAHLAVGLVAAVRHWDWAASLAALERAIELAPDSADVWYWSGSLFASLGRHEESIAHTRRALELDPTSPVINAALAWRLFEARRGEEAIAQAHHALELDPGYYDTWDNLKWIEITLGHEAQAVEAWTRAEELDTGDGEGVQRAYEAGGLENLHRESIKSQLQDREAGHYQSPYDLVLEYAALGEIEEALTWLEHSFTERETDLIDLAVDPRLDRLRGEERFQAVLAELRFPDLH